jgi:hypothetical protein
MKISTPAALLLLSGNCNVEGDTPEDVGNAYLIAGAPAMLAGLRRVLTTTSCAHTRRDIKRTIAACPTTYEEASK